MKKCCPKCKRLVEIGRTHGPCGGWMLVDDCGVPVRIRLRDIPAGSGKEMRRP